MPTILRRMKALREIISIRVGEGAAVLPPDVKKIHMHFHSKIEGGHRGAKKFWKIILPRLKYRNPTVPMTVFREHNPDMEALMSIHFKSQRPDLQTPKSTKAKTPIAAALGSTSGDAPTSDHKPTEKVSTINMKDKTESHIWAELKQLTNATDISPAPEELQAVQEIKDHKIKSAEASARGKEIAAAQKREKLLLAQARGEIKDRMDADAV